MNDRSLTAMTTDTNKIEELAKWHSAYTGMSPRGSAIVKWHDDQAALLRSLSVELTEWKIRCAELEQNAEHIQSSDEAEDLKRALTDCSDELTELRQAKESLKKEIERLELGLRGQRIKSEKNYSEAK